MSYESQQDDSQMTHEHESMSSSGGRCMVKSKNYRIKNKEWHCQLCSIYCNSVLQFEMHLISQKHKQIGLEQKARESESLNKSETGNTSISSTTNADTSEGSHINTSPDSIKSESVDENNNDPKTPATCEKPQMKPHHRQFKSSYSQSIKLDRGQIRTY